MNTIGDETIFLNPRNPAHWGSNSGAEMKDNNL